ncbi:TPA: helix-turn-helix domain-containing protein [Streptococcus agalactiae]|nr:helix-turn-helix transcriptional regulator [Streptococcus agalactiae]
MFEVYSRIDELAKKRGVSLQKVATDIGLSENYIYNLKNKKTANTEPIEKIANYFQVSTDYLLGRTDNPNIAKDNQGYTSDDLRKMAEKAKTFDGKPLTDSDIDAIQNIIEIYLKGR